MHVDLAAGPPPIHHAPGASVQFPCRNGQHPRAVQERTPGRSSPRPRHQLDLSALPGVDLATLAEQGELLTRLDRKYLVDLSVVPQFVAALRAGRAQPAVLDVDGHRQFAYESVYYDTPTLTSYLQTTRRRPRRFKVRRRTYLDSGASFLEVKTRDGRRRTVKTRMDLPRQDERWAIELDPVSQSFVAGQLARSVPAADDIAWTLTPTLSTRYRRATLLLPHDAARATIDVDLQALDRHGAGLVVPGLAIIETKTSGRASDADRVLWRLGQRPITISKYATALAALHPGLPATKWRPALRRLAAAPIPRVVPGHRATTPGRLEPDAPSPPR